MNDIGLFSSPLGADGGAAGDAAMDALPSATPLDWLNPIGDPLAAALNGVGTTEMTGVTSAADAVSNILPSKWSLLGGSFIVIVILVLVLLIIGKVETL